MMMMHSYFSLSLSSSSSSSLLPLKPRRRAQHHASYGHGHGRPSLPPFTPSCLPPSSARAASVTEANLPQPPPSPDPNPNASPNPNPNPNPNPEKSWKGRGSSSLSRWARARRLRSSPSSLLQPSVSFSPLTPATDARPSPSPPANDVDFDDEDELQREGTEKTIFMISDGTGWTAEHSVSAALGQFEYCLVDRGCPINTHLFSQINDVDRMIEIVRNAGEDNAIVLFTLADPAMADAARRACQLMGVPYVDILGPILDVLSLHLGVTPSGLPRGAPGRKRALSKDYFKRIEAVEFTIKQDDGALPKNLHKADIVLVGVSRTSKTPLSTYIAQKGYKVANVPLVLGIDPPKELFEINQSKIYALTIDPNFLQSIRIARRRSLGISSGAFYSDMSHIRDELEYSRDLFLRNPTWPVIEVTGKAIEETASVILRIYHDSKQKYAMPRISKRY